MFRLQCSETICANLPSNVCLFNLQNQTGNIAKVQYTIQSRFQLREDLLVAL